MNILLHHFTQIISINRRVAWEGGGVAGLPPLPHTFSRSRVLKNKIKL